MTYEEASGFWGTSQTDFEYDEAMCAAMPEPSMGKIKAKKVFLLNDGAKLNRLPTKVNHDYIP